MPVSIRRIRADDWSVLRDVRLRALLDTPSAFARTHAEEHEYAQERWALRAEWSADGDHSVYFLGFPSDGHQACGMVGGYLPDESSTPELVSMWVAPEHRGTAVARALVDKVVEWAEAAGYTTIELWVTRGNDRAISFYRRCGFSETAVAAPRPLDPCVDEIRMARPITP